MEMFNPPHPGGLIADILENGDLSVGRSVTAFARHIGVSRSGLAKVIQGRSPISVDLALRLQDALGVKAELWLSMQLKHYLWQATHKRRPKVESVVLSRAA